MPRCPRRAVRSLLACALVAALMLAVAPAPASALDRSWASPPIDRSKALPLRGLAPAALFPAGYQGPLTSLTNSGRLVTDDFALYYLWVFPGQTLDIRVKTSTDFVLLLLNETTDLVAASDDVVAGTERIVYTNTDHFTGPQVMFIGVGAVVGGPYTLTVSMTDAPTDPALKRLWGADRYQTAVQVSQDAFPEGADTVVIATGANFPDALSAAGLCGVCDAPLLLVPRDTLPAVVSAEIDRLGATRAFIVGGTGAVSSAVVYELQKKPALAGDGAIIRVAGPDRYMTAIQVAQRMRSEVGTDLPNAIVVCGTQFPDALSASPLAFADKRPILLTPSTYAHPQMLEALTSIGATDAVIVGGTGVVYDAVKRVIENRLGHTIARWAGLTRFDTAAVVAENSVEAGILSREYIGYAWGRGFPDGLAGGVAAGRCGGALLLTESYVEPEAMQAYNMESAALSDVAAARVFGGPGVIWGNVLGMIDDDLWGSVP
ncbi:MAG: cell wall-binding repeat-containing protein [Anaerosomatales bacterium]|nr:cell wall-binding repeat-containing protein [Anaerosomatales bacterium]